MNQYSVSFHTTDSYNWLGIDRRPTARLGRRHRSCFTGASRGYSSRHSDSSLLQTRASGDLSSGSSNRTGERMTTGTGRAGLGSSRATGCGSRSPSPNPRRGVHSLHLSGSAGKSPQGHSSWRTACDGTPPISLVLWILLPIRPVRLGTQARVKNARSHRHQRVRCPEGVKRRTARRRRRQQTRFGAGCRLGRSDAEVVSARGPGAAAVCCSQTGALTCRGSSIGGR